MKTLLVVPVYNCEPVINDVLKSLLSLTKIDILVVDDGSLVPVKIPQDEPRIFVLRKEVNQGKGAALQSSIKWAVENQYTHLLSFDGDGQHRAEDVQKMLDVSKENDESLVIGCREFGEGVPSLSRFGRRFSNFWVWYQTGAKVDDSQSGLRLYPLQKLKNFKFFTQRYDFEIEVLVRLIWSGTNVSETVVGVIYPAKEERISHFNKKWDNARITFLNVLLIIYSLVFYQRSLPKVLLAGGVAFLSSLVAPLIPAVILSVFTCVVLRLNVILVLTGFLVLRLT